MTITDKIDRITFISPEYSTVTPPAPKSVKIELTARCDFKCFFCASKNRLRGKGDIEWDFYCRVIREMREAGVEELGLFYLGESFLYEDLPKAIREAKAVGYPYVFMTTNGRMATAERVKACMEAGLDSLKFSYNSADPKQFGEITGVRGQTFHTVVDNIIAARKVRDEGGFSCGLYASSIQYDGEQLQKMQEAVDLIIDSVDEHYWLPLYGQAGLTAGERGTKPIAGNQGRVGALRPPLPCWSIFTEGHITYDGHLAACCFDHDGRFHMGDLNQLSFMDAWNSAPFQKLRDANLRKDVCGTACEKCVAWN